jgi:hypothetical protein
MQKRVEPASRLQHRAHVHQLGRLDAAVGMDRLRAVSAVLGAAAGLDRQQRRKLHFVGFVMGAVDLGSAENELGEGQVEQLGDFGASPVGAGFVHGFSPSRELAGIQGCIGGSGLRPS